MEDIKIELEDTNSNTSNSFRPENSENLCDTDPIPNLLKGETPSQPIYFNGVEISKLTKRQLKKYQKFLNWQKVKKEKRSKEKQKAKEKRKLAKELNIDTGPSRKALKRKKMECSPCTIGVCIDLSFDHLMIDKVGKVEVK